MLIQKLRKSQGFTLIELMIVVAIIGILAAIAIPNFLTYQCKSRQTEAKTNLGAIGTGNEAYFAENDSYAGTTQQVGFRPKGTVRYVYTITNSTSTFTATADGTQAQVLGDQWLYNNSRILVNSINVCT